MLPHYTMISYDFKIGHNSLTKLTLLHAYLAYDFNYSTTNSYDKCQIYSFLLLQIQKYTKLFPDFIYILV